MALTIRVNKIPILCAGLPGHPEQLLRGRDQMARCGLLPQETNRLRAQELNHPNQNHFWPPLRSKIISWKPKLPTMAPHLTPPRQVRGAYNTYP